MFRRPIPLAARRGPAGRPPRSGPQPAARSYTLEAPAKINLFLEVLGKRDDGYHELETVMAPLGLADRVTLSPLPTEQGVRLSVQGPLANTPGGEIPADDRNLVVRALHTLAQHTLAQHTGQQHGADVMLEKHIPAEAGLGGGSSDAAAALLLANAAWGLRLDAPQLQAVAASVGSDVPFFLATRPAICRGRGERVQPILAPVGMPCVLAKPTFGLSTAAVYGEIARHPGGLGEERSTGLVEALCAGDWRGVAKRQFNRLQESSFRLAAPLQQAAARLKKALPLEWIMTGSGSAFFALMPSWRAARRAAQLLRARGEGWAVATRTR